MITYQLIFKREKKSAKIWQFNDKRRNAKNRIKGLLEC